MKKIAVVLALMVFSLAIFLPFSFNTLAAQAQNTSYSIQNVTYNTRVLYSGYIVVSETIQISGSLPNKFPIGFPFQYGSYLIKGEAFDTNNNTLPVTLGISLQDQSGFYGSTVDLSTATSNTFTVVFIFSNGLLEPMISGYSLKFPAYPSFTTIAEKIDASLTLPSGATNPIIAKTDGSINTTTYTATNLAAFTYSPANATFLSEPDYLQKVTIPTLNRNINISPEGAIAVTDNYLIINNATASLSFFKINLPNNAENIVAKDQFGRVLSYTLQDTTGVTRIANVTFSVALGMGDSISLAMHYTLPSIIPQQSGQFVLSLDLYPYLNYYVNSVSGIVIPPQGATIISPRLSSLGNTSSLSRNAFQETLTVQRDGITYINRLFQSQDVLQVTYNYSPLWIAFLPTIWMFVIAMVGSVIIAIMLRPKSKDQSIKTATQTLTAAVGVKAEQIRTFIDSFEEKLRITEELKSLEARVQKGRIPRRRYKLQRSSIETRLATLNRIINDLKKDLLSSGGSHADIIRQLDAAEVTINEADLNLTTLETRHDVGEISLDDYKKQLTDLERRKAKAENTIDGLILRLRGEIR